MIDPLDAVIKFLAADAALAELVGDRIAAKHRYPTRGDGKGWSRDAAGLSVRLDGGTPDVDVPVQQIRLEVRCYAPSQYLASRTWQRLVGISRECNREPVLTSTGSALLYWLLQASGPSMLYDPDLKLDFILCFLDAAVAESEAV